MNRSGWRSRVTALITAIVVSVGLLGLSTAPAWAAAGTITEFPIPTASTFPRGITAGPDGNLWFTEYSGNKIGRITPAGFITEFPIPPTSSNPFGITAGPDGNLWFAEDGSNNIGRITPAGVVTGEFSIPTGDSRPFGITAGPDGNLWFTEFNGNNIGGRWQPLVHGVQREQHRAHHHQGPNHRVPHSHGQ